MPKQKHLNIRYTIRLSDYLSNEMVKYTLTSGQDYSSFIRMCITNYLKTRTQNSPMSATKTPKFDVVDEDLLSVDMFASSTVDIDDDSPCSPSLYGWD